jgi:hypothetical protein
MLRLVSQLLAQFHGSQQEIKDESLLRAESPTLRAESTALRAEIKIKALNLRWGCFGLWCFCFYGVSVDCSALGENQVLSD